MPVPATIPPQKPTEQTTELMPAEAEQTAPAQPAPEAPATNE